MGNLIFFLLGLIVGITSPFFGIIVYLGIPKYYNVWFAMGYGIGSTLFIYLFLLYNLDNIYKKVIICCERRDNQKIDDDNPRT